MATRAAELLSADMKTFASMSDEELREALSILREEESRVISLIRESASKFEDTLLRLAHENAETVRLCARYVNRKRAALTGWLYRALQEGPLREFWLSVLEPARRAAMAREPEAVRARLEELARWLYGPFWEEHLTSWLEGISRGTITPLVRDLVSKRYALFLDDARVMSYAADIEQELSLLYDLRGFEREAVSIAEELSATHNVEEAARRLASLKRRETRSISRALRVMRALLPERYEEWAPRIRPSLRDLRALSRRLREEYERFSARQQELRARLEEIRRRMGWASDFIRTPLRIARTIIRIYALPHIYKEKEVPPEEKKNKRSPVGLFSCWFVVDAYMDTKTGLLLLDEPLTRREIQACKRAMLYIWVGFDYTALRLYAMKMGIPEGSSAWNTLATVLKEGPSHPRFKEVADRVIRVLEENGYLFMATDSPFEEEEKAIIVPEPAGAFLIRVRRLEVRDVDFVMPVSFAHYLRATEGRAEEDIRKRLSEIDKEIEEARRELAKREEDLRALRESLGRLIEAGVRTPEEMALRTMLEGAIRSTEEAIRELRDRIRELERERESVARETRRWRAIPQVFTDIRKFMDYIAENVPSVNIDLLIPTRVAMTGATPARWQEVGVNFGLVATYDSWARGYLPGVPGYGAPVEVEDRTLLGPASRREDAPSLAVLVYPRWGDPEEMREFEELKTQMMLNRLRGLGLERFMADGGSYLNLGYLDCDNAALDELIRALEQLRDTVPALRNARMDIHESTPGNYHVEIYVPSRQLSSEAIEEVLRRFPLTDPSFVSMCMHERTCVLRIGPKAGTARRYVCSLCPDGILRVLPEVMVVSTLNNRALLGGRLDGLGV